MRIKARHGARYKEYHTSPIATDRGMLPRLNFKSYQDISITIWRNLYRIPAHYDLIVGVPRSGMIPATILAEYLHVSLASLDSFVKGDIMPCGRTRTSSRQTPLGGIRNVLVIDDSVYSGTSICEAKAKIRDSEILRPLHLRIDYAVVYCLPERTEEVDFFFEPLRLPRCFQWNIFNHPTYTTRSCFDIDGVITRDPTEEENDDGEKYLRFLETAPVRIPIQFRVGAFVSSRLEKYRPQTEKWLLEHGFVYNDLILLNLPTKEERMRQNAHASFKAEVYKSRTETLFIESDFGQAQEIARITGKDVFCTDTMSLISGGNRI